MSVSYLQSQKQRVRVTLDLDVFEDFDARNINWEKLFDLEPGESVYATVDDLDVSW